MNFFRDNVFTKNHVTAIPVWIHQKSCFCSNVSLSSNHPSATPIWSSSPSSWRNEYWLNSSREVNTSGVLQNRTHISQLICGTACYSTVPGEVCFQGSSSCVLYSACIGIVSPCWLESTHRKQWGHTQRLDFLLNTQHTCWQSMNSYHSCRSFQTQPALQSSGPHSEPPFSVDRQPEHI